MDVGDQHGQHVRHGAAIRKFVSNLRWRDVPDAVKTHVRYAVLDLCGAMVAGTRTRVAEIMRDTALRSFPGDDATLFVYGGRASLPGAVMSNSFAANALDIDDGYRRIKGHPGAVVVPAAAAAAEEYDRTWGEFLSAVLVGYEVAIRAGIAWHEYHPEYHGSGSWGSVGAAAVTGRLAGAPEDTIGEAMGVAEYHAPLVPMMRGIDVPCMAKDGIGWGAMVGTTSALMALDGFTGIPCILEMERFSSLSAELGERYLIEGLYFKPYACCRWAQPAVTAVATFREEVGFTPEDVAEIRIATFAESARLSQAPPRNTEEAQYNIAFPVAAAVVFGEVGADQVVEPGIHDPRVLAMMRKVAVREDERLQRDFPATCQCEVDVVLTDGTTHSSGIVGARGDPDNPLGYRYMEGKFDRLVQPVLGSDHAQGLRHAILCGRPDEPFSTVARLLVGNRQQGAR